MNENWADDADLDGRPPLHATEEALQRASEAIYKALQGAGDFVGRWELHDVSDWLAGTLGAPGSAWPVRPPIAAFTTCGYVCSHGNYCIARLGEDLTCAKHGLRTGRAIKA